MAARCVSDHVALVVPTDDYACYASLTTEIASNMYAEDDLIGRHYTVWLAFAVGQVVRPFGGGLFGIIADRIGRKPALLFATCGMLVSTTAMGCLPTRRMCGELCGTVGAVLMVLLRAGQGLCAAGEVVVMYTLCVEQAGSARAGLGIAAAAVSGTVGFLLASLIAALMESSTGEEERLDWGWRVPFWLALPIGIPILLWQRRMEESTEFRALHDAPGGKRTPDGKLIAGGAVQQILADAGTGGGGVGRRDAEDDASCCYGCGCGGSLCSPAMLVCFGTISGHGGFFWGTASYFKDMLVTDNLAPVGLAGIAATLALAVGALSTALAGLAIDATSLSFMARLLWPMQMLLLLPAWWLLTSPTGDPSMVLSGATIVGISMAPGAMYVGVSLAVFPVSRRAAGFGVAYNLAMLCFAAPAPLVNNAIRASLSHVMPEIPDHVANTIGPAAWSAFGILVAGVALACARGRDGVSFPTFMDQR